MPSIEGLRFSKQSKQAFGLLQNVCKYNMFEKAGASITRKIQMDGKILNPQDSSDRSSRTTKKRTRTTQTKPNSRENQLSRSPQLSRAQMKSLRANFSHGKAGALDGVRRGEGGLFRIHTRRAAVPKSRMRILPPKSTPH